MLDATQRNVYTLLWNHGKNTSQTFKFPDSTDTVADYRFDNSRVNAISSQYPIVNVVPGDFNNDGRLDVLLVSQKEPAKFKCQVQFGNGFDTFCTFPVAFLHAFLLTCQKSTLWI